MKPKHYVDKYNLDKSDRFSHPDFVADLTFDFMTLLEFQQQSGVWNYAKFQNCVKEIRQKFDSISNKTIGTGLPEKIWKYFFASVVVPIRDEMFGDYLRAKQEQHEKRKRDRERWDDPFHGFGQSSHQNYWDDMFSNYLSKLLYTNRIPSMSFAVLGLREESSGDDVKSKYRELVKVHHPDKGGSSNKFKEITEAKNRCLAYINRG